MMTNSRLRFPPTALRGVCRRRARHGRRRREMEGDASRPRQGQSIMGPPFEGADAGLPPVARSGTTQAGRPVRPVGNCNASGLRSARSGSPAFVARWVETHLTGREPSPGVPATDEAMRSETPSSPCAVKARPLLAIFSTHRRIGGIEDRAPCRRGGVIGRRRRRCFPGRDVADERASLRGLVGFGFLHSGDFQLGKEDLAGMMRDAAGRTCAGRRGGRHSQRAARLPGHRYTASTVPRQRSSAPRTPDEAASGRVDDCGSALPVSGSLGRQWPMRCSKTGSAW